MDELHGIFKNSFFWYGGSFVSNLDNRYDGVDMMEIQLEKTLFDLINTSYRNKREEAFIDFHEDNPEVYELFDQFCRDYISKGKTKISAAMIINRIRWEKEVMTSDDEFKISNNHQPYYAREWVKKNPQYKSFFNFKKVEGENERVI